MDNPAFLSDQSVQEAAKVIETSPAALVRFSKKIGYKGLAELKIDLDRYAEEKPSLDDNNDETPKTAVLNHYRRNLNLIEEQLDEKQLQRIATTMLEAKDLKILGIGSSGLNAEQMVYNLLYQDCYTESVTSKTKMYYLSRSLKKETALLFYTVSGNTDFKAIFKAAKEAGSKTIIVTMVDNAYVRKYADELVILPSNAMQVDQKEGSLYLLDNRSIFSIFSEILSSYIALELK